MKNLTQFQSDNLWPTLRKLSKKARSRVLAVSYFGKGAVRQLSLRKGDTLVIAMSKANVKAGIIYPSEVELALRKGVRVYKYENLHAKVYVFDTHAIVCSANASIRSEKTLQEAGLLTGNLTAVKNARAFVKSLCVEQVDQQYVNLCKKIYRPPRTPSLGNPEGRSNRKPSAYSNLWVINTFPADPSEEDQRELDKTEPGYVKKLRNASQYHVEDIEFRGSARIIEKVKYGDRVVELHKDGAVVRVYSKLRVLGVTRSKKTGRSFIRIEARNNEAGKSWTSFERHLHKHGIRYIKKRSTRNIRSEEAKRAILTFIGK